MEREDNHGHREKKSTKLVVEQFTFKVTLTFQTVIAILGLRQSLVLLLKIKCQRLTLVFKLKFKKQIKGISLTAKGF